jgi:hypothetical protein
LLYTEAKQYLLDRLKAAGLRSNPYTTRKSLEKSQESHIGAVLFEREVCARNGSKKRFRDEEGAKHKRRRVFDRDLTFTVIIGDYSDDSAEAIFERFISSLDPGIYVGGNFVSIDVDGADWVDRDDSILKAQVAVQVSVTFHGGVYRDTDFGPLTRIELVEVERKNGKETANGQ